MQHAAGVWSSSAAADVVVVHKILMCFSLFPLHTASRVPKYAMLRPDRWWWCDCYYDVGLTVEFHQPENKRSSAFSGVCFRFVCECEHEKKKIRNWLWCESLPNRRQKKNSAIEEEVTVGCSDDCSSWKCFVFISGGLPKLTGSEQRELCLPKSEYLSFISYAITNLAVLRM